MSQTTRNIQASRLSTRNITVMAMLTAMAYLVMFLSKIIFAPLTVAGFLTFDLKDVVIAIGGFLFGPMSALMVSVITSLIEMLTVSGTGPVGCLMNVLATITFVCPAAWIYKRRHSISGAVVGLIVGGLLMTVIMLLWNYLITPMYMGYPRELVVAMLVPIFLPFNLIKGLMNGALVMVLYKPVVGALRKANLAPASEEKNKKTFTLSVCIIAGLVMITGILLAMVLVGII